MRETLIAIETPPNVRRPFCAGIVARNGRVVEAANIHRFMKGWTGRQVADYCSRKGWSWERVVSMDDGKQE